MQLAYLCAVQMRRRSRWTFRIEPAKIRCAGKNQHARADRLPPVFFLGGGFLWVLSVCAFSSFGRVVFWKQDVQAIFAVSTVRVERTKRSTSRASVVSVCGRERGRETLDTTISEYYFRASRFLYFREKKGVPARSAVFKMHRYTSSIASPCTDLSLVLSFL